MGPISICIRSIIVAHFPLSGDNSRSNSCAIEPPKRNIIPRTQQRQRQRPRTPIIWNSHDERVPSDSREDQELPCKTRSIPLLFQHPTSLLAFPPKRKEKQERIPCRTRRNPSRWSSWTATPKHVIINERSHFLLFSRSSDRVGIHLSWSVSRKRVSSSLPSW